MSTCTGGDELLLELYPPSKTDSLPSSEEEFYPVSRGATSGRASSSKYLLYSRSSISKKVPGSPQLS